VGGEERRRVAAPFSTLVNSLILSALAPALRPALVTVSLPSMATTVFTASPSISSAWINFFRRSRSRTRVLAPVTASLPSVSSQPWFRKSVPQLSALRDAGADQAHERHPS
jgi:hypothetical protein